MGRIALLAVALVAGGCGMSEPVVVDLPEGTPLRRAESSVSPAFGGSHPGRSVWLSRNGRYAVIFQWREDTDGDGKVSIAIGYHGSMVDDEPRPYLVDVRTGATTGYDELLSASAGRWVALREGRRTWLVDTETGTREELGGSAGLAEGDGNACVAPRSLTFDAPGERVGVIPHGSASFLVRDLDGNGERRIEGGEDVLWRARFTRVEDVVVLYLVPRDSARADTAGGLPRQNTTCVSRFGMMFAGSASGQGWEGPPFYAVVVAPGGRRLRLAEAPVVLSEDLVAAGDTALLRIDGSRITLPADCEGFQGAPGSPAVLLECGVATRLFDPVRGRSISLPMPVKPVRSAAGFRDGRGRTWLPVMAWDTAARAPRLGRLRTADGRLEIGPVISAGVDVEGDGWAVTRTDNAVHALEIATGRQVTLAIEGDVLDVGFPLVMLRPGAYLLLDPAGGRYIEATEPGARNDRGCFLEASGEYDAGLVAGGVEQGPWRLRCAAEK